MKGKTSDDARWFMKKFLLMLAALLWAGHVSAATMYFSADNTITSFKVNGVDVWSTLINEGDWKKIDSLIFNPISGMNTIEWEISNTGGLATSATSGGNPMAFIGLVDIGSAIFQSGISSIGWSFSSAVSTLYELANSGSIWANNGFAGATETSGANWVGYTGASSMTATLTFDYKPVPVPAAVWMLGTGLVAVLGMRRKMAA